MRYLLFLLILYLNIIRSIGANTTYTDSLASPIGIVNKDTVPASLSQRTVLKQYKFRATQLINPATLIGVGFIGLESDWLKYHNNETRDELQEHFHPKVSIDDFSQYVPLAATFGIKLCGVKSLHGYGDMAILATTSYMIMGLSVYGIKSWTKVERPDASTRNSFPSGHTATAFAGAELLRREYWNTTPWIGVGGYVIAAGTGFLRMYNNRHWLTDVIAGAGIGILSVQAVYWLYPVITKTFFKKRYKQIFLAPTVDSRHIGLSTAITF